MRALTKEEIYRLVDEYRALPDGKTIVLFGAGHGGTFPKSYENDPIIPETI